MLVRPIFTLSASSSPISRLFVARIFKLPAVVMWLVVMPSGVNARSEILRSVGVRLRSPVLAPVADVVAATQVSPLSSHTNAAFALSPRSMTIPLSPEGVPVVPFASSINLSVIVVLVLVVVLPDTVRSPVTVRLLKEFPPYSRIV